MPLRDHFRSPLTTIASWEELQVGWPMVIVQQLRKKLPPGYVAGPPVYAGARVEIDDDEYEVRIYDAERVRDDVEETSFVEQFGPIYGTDDQ